MTATQDMHHVTPYRNYQPPAIMAGQDSASAFNADWLGVRHRPPVSNPWGGAATSVTGSRVVVVDPDRELAHHIDRPAGFHSQPVPSQQNEAVTLTNSSVTVFRFDHALTQKRLGLAVDQLLDAFDFGRAPDQELAEKTKRARANLQDYEVRIEELCTYAKQDGYGLNTASKLDFWRFVQSEPFIRKGDLTLIDNGNLRAIWEGEHGAHIGLQFLGRNTVQYVIFKRRSAAGTISRVCGRDNFEGVKRQIVAFDLWFLIHA